MMSDFQVTLLSCLITGVAFASLASWLTCHAGNRIADIVKAAKGEESEALHVEIGKMLKLSANAPIVALYLVAAAVAFGLPAFLKYHAFSQYEVWHVEGSVSGAPRLSETGVVFHPPSLPIDSDGRFSEDILVKLDENGHRRFPSITFTPSSAGYGLRVLHLGEPLPTYAQKIDGQSIRVTDPIEFGLQSDASLPGSVAMGSPSN